MAGGARWTWALLPRLWSRVCSLSRVRSGVEAPADLPVGSSVDAAADDAAGTGVGVGGSWDGASAGMDHSGDGDGPAAVVMSLIAATRPGSPGARVSGCTRTVMRRFRGIDGVSPD